MLFRFHAAGDAGQLLLHLLRLAVVLFHFNHGRDELLAQRLNEALLFGRVLKLGHLQDFQDGWVAVRDSCRNSMSLLMINRERDSALRTAVWPRSMRLASSISPSRVSSGTMPISRK